MAMTIGSNFELCLGLCAPNLTGGALLTRFFLAALRVGEHFSGTNDGGLAFADLRFDFSRRGIEVFDTGQNYRLAFAESVDQGSRFGGFPRSALVLAAERRGTLCGLGTRAPALGRGLVCQYGSAFCGGESCALCLSRQRSGMTRRGAIRD
jgi:hypothetical protein